MTLRIDAHQHYWQLDCGHGDWPPADLTAIYKDFTPQDMAHNLRTCGIDGTVVVQSNPHLGDTRFLLDLAERHDSIKGVVGWVDLLSPDAAQDIANLAWHTKFKGVRAMLQDQPAVTWIEDPRIQPAIDMLIKHDLSLDALVSPVQIQSLVIFAKRNHELRIVIDHGGKPDIANRKADSWLFHLQQLAACPHVHCKLSGLLTEAGSGEGLEVLRPYMDDILMSFGTERVMWGSDWPVVNIASDYATWWQICHHYLHEHPALSIRKNAAQVLGANACRFYRLDTSA